MTLEKAAGPSPDGDLHLRCNEWALAIWRTHAEEHRAASGMHLLPMVRGRFEIGTDLLFVGMNPSVSADATMVAGALKSPDSEETRQLLWHPGQDDATLATRVRDLIALESKARTSYMPFYGPLQEFADNVGAENWDHLDMFLMRHTSQRDVLSTHRHKTGFHEPAAEMLELFKSTLKEIGPRLVVIANAGAANIAIDYLPLKPDEEERVYSWADLPGVPFYLSSMLSGQRALDNFSKRRLEAEVRTALQKAKQLPEDSSQV